MSTTGLKGFQNSDLYSSVRPGYPEDVLRYVTDLVSPRLCLPGSVDVLELGAGTGLFTKQFVQLLPKTCRYVATEVSQSFLDRLTVEVPTAECQLCDANDLSNLENDSVKVVLAVQCFHWFANEQALAEIARVLVPGGLFLVIFNNWRLPEEWEKKLQHDLNLLFKAQDAPIELHEAWLKLANESTAFENKEKVDFSGWFKEGDVDFWVDYYRSYSVIVCLGEEERETELAKIRQHFENGLNFQKSENIIKREGLTKVFQMSK